MKTDNATTVRSCPLCGVQYGGFPALSRKFPNTHICPDCGTREALESIGVSTAEQEKILAIIHGSNIHKDDIRVTFKDGTEIKA